MENMQRNAIRSTTISAHIAQHLNIDHDAILGSVLMLSCLALRPDEIIRLHYHDLSDSVSLNTTFS